LVHGGVDRPTVKVNSSIDYELTGTFYRRT